MKIPSKLEVQALANRTGESPRKCYYWLLHELNKDSPQEQPSLFQDVQKDTPKDKKSKSKK